MKEKAWNTFNFWNKTQFLFKSSTWGSQFSPVLMSCRARSFWLQHFSCDYFRQRQAISKRRFFQFFRHLFPSFSLNFSLFSDPMGREGGSGCPLMKFSQPWDKFPGCHNRDTYGAASPVPLTTWRLAAHSPCACAFRQISKGEILGKIGGPD